MEAYSLPLTIVQVTLRSLFTHDKAIIINQLLEVQQRLNFLKVSLGFDGYLPTCYGL